MDGRTRAWFDAYNAEMARRRREWARAEATVMLRKLFEKHGIDWPEG